MQVAKRFAKSPEVAAELLADLASNPGWARTTGAYFVDGRLAPIAPVAREEGVAEKLWVESSRLAGMPVDIG
jgi:hypothetical protein